MGLLPNALHAEMTAFVVVVVVLFTDVSFPLKKKILYATHHSQASEHLAVFQKTSQLHKLCKEGETTKGIS